MPAKTSRPPRTDAVDPREQPAYTVTEAARYLRLPAATLRSWVGGRSYHTTDGIGRFQPLIHPPGSPPLPDQPLLLSFSNLIEAHVLRSLRTRHGVSLKKVRSAIDYAERSQGVERLLLSKELQTHAGEVFLDKFGSLINLSRSGQLAMRRMLADHLKRVEWDDRNIPFRFRPFLTRDSSSSDASIVIDPAIAFGRSVIHPAGITTQAIAGRLDAGENVADLALDYDLDETEIELAALFERAA